MGLMMFGRAARGAATTPQSSIFAQPILVEDIESCFFYHTVDLPGHGTVEGAWDLRGRFSDYVGGIDVADKRVLDVGTASGFLSFEAERHGAREVVSFDLDSAERQTLLPFAGSEYVENHAAWSAKQTAAFLGWKRSYWFSRRALRSETRVVYGDVYAPPRGLGTFDVVILGAILEHLVDPLSALTAIATLSTDTVVINTDYLDSAEPVAVFNGRADRPEANFIFWTYSVAIYQEFMAILGFEPVAVHKSSFAGARASADVPRPMLPRVALVYRRKAASAGRAGR